ncbi:MAG: hypothetical protein SOV16_10310 [Anaerobiospirillum succiniciproducens]|uniref:hypothetical protein n=1 Tax=Anaerobiospirillum succiniciproducens TaxID=13335 RepID=UPI0023564E73|nr:hypothetical protein [Anaerobiospirillum succiniciproducens]MCI6862600.1 hypothetical protein [Anaerobiospirillum succiniciproducens]MDY2799533.1 hypothetical protein [Anaerobiospirillum succiniciproducens]
MSFKGSRDYFRYLFEELGQIRYDYRVAVRRSRRYFDGLVMDALFLASQGVEKYSNKLANEISFNDVLLKPFDIFYEALEEEERLEQLLTSRKHIEREHKLLIALPKDLLDDILTGFCWQTYALGRTCKHMNNLIHKIILSLDGRNDSATLALCNDLRATCGCVKDLRRDILDALDGMYFDVTGNRYHEENLCLEIPEYGNELKESKKAAQAAQENCSKKHPNHMQNGNECVINNEDGTEYELAPYEGPEVSNCFIYALDIYLTNEIRQALDKNSGHYGFSNDGRRVFRDDDQIEAKFLNNQEKLLKVVKTRRLLRMFRTFIYVIQSFKYALEAASEGVERVRSGEPQISADHDKEFFDYIGSYMSAVDKYKRKGRQTPPLTDDELIAATHTDPQPCSTAKAAALHDHHK